MLSCSTEMFATSLGSGGTRFLFLMGILCRFRLRVLHEVFEHLAAVFVIPWDGSSITVAILNYSHLFTCYLG